MVTSPGKKSFNINGFAIVSDMYDSVELAAILNAINKGDKTKDTFRKTHDLFAIRQVLKEVPELSNLVFNQSLKSLIRDLFGDEYFVVKSIYFDKPTASNWFVPWHQDLTVSVDKKVECDGYGPWTVKQNQFAVQPPLAILKENFTIRIHLDDADEGNGALKVLPGSHLKEIYRPETIDWKTEKPYTCNVKAGDIMIMRPLLMHASSRTTNNKPRKVIHIEFAKAELPSIIKWSERLALS
ncbi:phytanoyl-CoA dioxygenase [Mucilaginibacter sp. MD40]|nr:phytanoyl-CoA dioxygenase [Mucilaginibacter sp. MD40]